MKQIKNYYLLVIITRILIEYTLIPNIGII